MRKLFYTIAFLGIALFATPSSAQVSIHINIGNQPLWGPSGYDYVRYYYMPEYDMYYDVQLSRYAYWNYDRWVLSPVLPARYAHVNLYRTHKVVLNTSSPWLQHNYHRNRYHHYASNRNQISIRDYRNSYKVHGKNAVRSGVSGTIRSAQTSHANNNNRMANVNLNKRSTNSSKR
ncbi:MAG TPA: hypothetical protein PKA53_10065 [Sphingobacterium sp.]|nr:hypothetical protein [Sphingobacterium sp.]